MELRMKLLTLSCTAFLLTSIAYANAPVTINNNNYPAQPQAQGSSPQQQSNNNNNLGSSGNGATPDPRVAPEGTYNNVANSNGGPEEDIYTTGEKKPYIVDNNQNSTTAPVVQPYVNVQPPSPPVR